MDDQRSFVRAGSVVEIPAGMRHSIKAQTNLQMIEVQMGSPLIEEDVVKIFDSWEKVVELCGGKANEVKE